MRAKLAAGVVGAAVAVATATAPAMAAGSGNINGNNPAVITVPAAPVGDPPVTSIPVTINYSGFAPSSLLFIWQCKKTGSDPTWTGFTNECEAYSEIVTPATATGSGANGDFSVLVNDAENLNSNWFCQSPVGPATNSLGRTGINQCYVRVTQNTAANEADAFYVPITFVDAGPIVPESPANVLLPVGAAAGVAVAGYLALRNRRLAAA